MPAAEPRHAGGVDWRIGGDRLLSARAGPLVMGIVNVTPDSFSGDGLGADTAAAVSQGEHMWAAGADLVDVGGESTRPGAEPVPAADEMRRVVPVVAALAEAGVAVSVDTAKAAVAEAALAAGAVVVNDVTALADPDMVAVACAAGAGVVLMHMQGTPRTMQRDPRYDDVVGDVRRFLADRAAAAEAAGIERARICIDPGIGFGKTVDHNLALLGRLSELVATGYPVLVGASRKSFLTKVLGPLSPVERDEATAVVTALAAAAGAAVMRVHDVERTVRATRLAGAIVRPALEAGAQ